MCISVEIGGPQFGKPIFKLEKNSLQQQLNPRHCSVVLGLHSLWREAR
jgi:hypothetical protein